MDVIEISAPETHDLRRRVLRVGLPSTEVAFPEDDLPATFHLGVLEKGRIVATSTWTPADCQYRPGAMALRLRGMATDPECQRVGVGRFLIECALGRARTDGYAVVWANARDSALGFYEKLGMAAVGVPFVSDETGLPHHAVVVDL